MAVLYTRRRQAIGSAGILDDVGNFFKQGNGAPFVGVPSGVKTPGTEAACVLRGGGGQFFKLGSGTSYADVPRVREIQFV